MQFTFIQNKTKMNDANNTNETNDYWQQIQHIFLHVSPIELLLTSLVPIVMVVSAGACFKLWLKINLFFSFLYGFAFIFYPEGILSLTVNIFF